MDSHAQSSEQQKNAAVRRFLSDDFGWAKALLAAARRSGEVARSVGEEVEKFSSPFARPCFEDAERQLAALCDLIRKRDRANFVTKRVRRLLASLSEEQSRVLRLRYIGRVSAGGIAQAFGISRRSVYRRLDAALAEFCAHLRATERKGEREVLLGEGWFRCIAENSAGREARASVRS